MRGRKRTVEIEFSKVKELKRNLCKKDLKDGDVLKGIREALGLNQRAFADKIGVESMTISRWERNQINNPCLTLEQCTNLNRLLKKIDLDIYELNIDFQILMDLKDFKTYGLVHNALNF